MLFSTRYHYFFHRRTNWTLTSQVSEVAIQLRLHYSVTDALRVVKTDSKSSVLILLDLSDAFDLLLFSCPPSHHWASQRFHFAGFNPISQVGLSGWPGEGRYPKNINWSLGYLREQFLDSSSSTYTLHHRDPPYRHTASPTIAMLMTHSSIFHFNQMIQW